MKQTIRGKVIKLGDRVNTDVIAPGRWKAEPMDTLKLHTMEAIRPDFYRSVSKGDILVAGSDFGCGSHREQATEIMKHLGVSAIVADSIARLYFRNGIAFGLPVIAAAGISGFVDEGETLEIEMQDSAIILRNTDKRTEMKTAPLPEIMRNVLNAGGIYEYLKKQKEGGKPAPEPRD